MLVRPGLIPRNRGAGFVQSLGPAAWYRFGIGITSSGGLVSAWADQSGNGRHLVQATDTNKPTLDSDGSILFDGSDNFMQASYTRDQPRTVYLLMKQVTWTIARCIFDGVSTAQFMSQAVSSPNVRISAGVASTVNSNAPVGSFVVIAAVFNGASSLIQVNNTAPVVSDAGSNNTSGFTLGAFRDGTLPANIAAKEGLDFGAAHDAATRSRVIRYLAQVGGLAL